MAQKDSLRGGGPTRLIPAPAPRPRDVEKAVEAEERDVLLGIVEATS